MYLDIMYFYFAKVYQMGQGSIKVSHSLNARNNHFAVMKDGYMGRVPFSNKGSGEEF